MGYEYTAANCSIISHSSVIQCLTVPGIGDNLRFTVSIMGQTSSLSVVSMAYARPHISTLTDCSGPTMGRNG